MKMAFIAVYNPRAAGAESPRLELEDMVMADGAPRRPTGHFTSVVQMRA